MASEQRYCTNVNLGFELRISIGVNSLYATENYNHPLYVIGPTCHRHTKKSPTCHSVAYKGWVIFFNGIQGINSSLTLGHGGRSVAQRDPDPGGFRKETSRGGWSVPPRAGRDHVRSKKQYGMVRGARSCWANGRKAAAAAVTRGEGRVWFSV